MDDKLTTKAAKFTSLENLYVYGIQKQMRNKVPIDFKLDKVQSFVDSFSTFQVYPKTMDFNECAEEWYVPL